jgi:ATP-dependent Zn protease
VRRFFRSAAFPILIVLVLAFFASRVISPGEPEDVPTYNEFIERVDSEPDSIETVTFEQKQNKLKYTLTDGTEYETATSPSRKTSSSTRSTARTSRRTSTRSRAAASSAR